MDRVKGRLREPEESNGPRMLKHRTVEDRKASVLPHGIAAPPILKSKAAL